MKNSRSRRKLSAFLVHSLRDWYYFCFTPTRSRSLAFVGVSHRGNAFPRFQCLRHKPSSYLFLLNLRIFHFRSCSLKKICEICQKSVSSVFKKSRAPFPRSRISAFCRPFRTCLLFIFYPGLAPWANSVALSALKFHQKPYFVLLNLWFFHFLFPRKTIRKVRLIR